MTHHPITRSPDSSLQLSQRGNDRKSGRADGGQQTANKAHEDRVVRAVPSSAGVTANANAIWLND